MLPFILLLIAGVSCRGVTAHHEAQLASGRPTISSESDGQMSEMKTLLRHLGSDHKDERENAKRAIVILANESPENRQEVIKELVEIVTVSNKRSPFYESHDRFLSWMEAVDIVGTLRATEAIDVLIQCLDCDVGVSGLGPGRYPAAMAVIKIGKAAIPALAASLEHERLEIRFKAVEALYAIGGDDAREVLRSAERKQSDRLLKSTIRDIIRDWKKSGWYKVSIIQLDSVNFTNPANIDRDSSVVHTRPLHQPRSFLRQRSRRRSTDLQSLRLLP
ncbi:MAG TPA: HEAT repeat domain-containing protein [Pyrinomonadaceae bacterium]|jgi:hypothetical protein